MAGQSNLKRAWTELGGKSANIVCADCPDLDAAVARDRLYLLQPGRKLQRALAPVRRGVDQAKSSSIRRWP
jgi:hypothetical protein